LDNSFVVKDDLETGHFNTIPLWLFGFMYWVQAVSMLLFGFLFR
jgi:hypothetical protein